MASSQSERHRLGKTFHADWFVTSAWTFNWDLIAPNQLSLHLGSHSARTDIYIICPCKCAAFGFFWLPDLLAVLVPVLRCWRQLESVCAFSGKHRWGRHALNRTVHLQCSLAYVASLLLCPGYICKNSAIDCFQYWSLPSSPAAPTTVMLIRPWGRKLKQSSCESGWAKQLRSAILGG